MDLLDVVSRNIENEVLSELRAKLAKRRLTKFVLSFTVLICRLHYINSVCLARIVEEFLFQNLRAFEGMLHVSPPFHLLKIVGFTHLAYFFVFSLTILFYFVHYFQPLILLRGIHEYLVNLLQQFRLPIPLLEYSILHVLLQVCLHLVLWCRTNLAFRDFTQLVY